MKSYSKGRLVLVTLIALVALGIAHQLWHWEVERVEVLPGEYLVLIHRWGKSLDEGQIVEQGSHTDLMHSGGLYAEMFTTQARSYGIEV